MDPLSAAGTIIAIFQLSADVLKYVTSAKGATKERRRLRDEIIACESVLIKLHDHVDDAGENKDWGDKMGALDGPDKPLSRLWITFEALRTKLEPKTGLDKALSTLKWPFDEKQVGKLISTIQHEKELLQLGLTYNCQALLKRIRETSDQNRVALVDLMQTMKIKWTEDLSKLTRLNAVMVQIQESQGHIEAGVRDLRQHSINQKQRTILDWITPIDYVVEQNDISKTRQPKTGQWFLASSEFQTWVKSKGQTLLCPGIPGAGKTVLTSIATDHLQVMFRDDPSVGIACIYCNFRRQHEQTVEHLLRSLLKQLVQARPSLLDSVEALYQRHREEGVWPSIDDVFFALQSVAATYSRVFILIDALDECKATNGRASRFLSEILLLQAKYSINIFATSRSIPVILDKFKGCPQLEIRANEQDIGQYVDGQLSYLPSFVENNPSLQEEIKCAIVKAADGMFLLSRLHLDSLMGKRSPKALRTALKTLPTGCNAYDLAYSEAMNRINCQILDHVELAKQVLSWIVCAKRPLTTMELKHALAIELGEEEFDPDNIPQIQDMVSVCAGLVTVDQESDIIRLTHYTTQKYFERTRNQWFPDAEAYVTDICLTYLSYDCHKSGSYTSDNEFEDGLRSNPLYEYAARNWGFHARAAGFGDENSVLSFLLDESKVSRASQVLMADRNYHYRGYSQDVPKQMTGIHLAAYFGLRSTIAVLLEQNVDSQLKDGYGRTPLSYAAERGQDAVVTLLLAEPSSDPDSEDSIAQWTPLWYAVSMEQLSVVKLLLNEQLVDPDAKSRYGQTPLAYAAEKGYAEIVKLLLDTHRVDPNFQNPGLCRTPLSLAAGNGHEEATRILLENTEVDLNSRDHEYGRTALSWAAERGHEKVVKLLLEKDGIDQNVVSKYGRTPLWFAQERGHDTIVNLLLSKGGQNTPVQQSHPAYTPLWKAAEIGQISVVESLLRNGADPNWKSEYGRTPLSYAAERGQERVVQMLLEEHQLDPDSKDSEYERTPLSWAAANGHVTIVNLLLEDGRVNPDSRSKYGQTPLSWAARFGHEIVVQLLLKRDSVDLNSKSNYGRTPLSYAAEKGYKSIVELLLVRDEIDFTSKDDEYGRTPLSWATANGHNAVVDLLLRKSEQSYNSSRKNWVRKLARSASTW